MSEGSFWKIYFVLLHPRICRHDAELLSTPQIMKTRMMLTQELQHRAKEMGSAFSVGTTNSASEVAPTDQPESLPVEMSAIGSAASSEAMIAEIPIIGNDRDDWLKEENADTAGVGGNHAPIANDEDVSFSDLEDDDYDDDPGNHQKIIKSFHGRSSYPQNDADTININTEHCDTNKVSGHIHGKKESIDWLDFNDTDSA
ncbi:hypothetical protein Nepgr_016696 [Nepenthes gracilis]|uniref:BSD domain-containing protein n=1 Tax=Nepenthes gracilis TaxID=150966 RepID=A0AAD3SN36_NEPGR|nr:hypothetical protein Nepgr_016696 [Nepenthes gracilis]